VRATFYFAIQLPGLRVSQGAWVVALSVPLTSPGAFVFGGRVAEMTKQGQEDSPFFRVAIHEAGHAVIAYHYGGKPGGLVLEKEEWASKGEVGSFTREKLKYNVESIQSAEGKEQVHQLVHAIMEMVGMFLGGCAAEYVLDGEPEAVETHGSETDIKNTKGFLKQFGFDDTRSKEIINLSFSESVEILKDKWQAVYALATALDTKETLSSDEVVKIIQENL
jgi:hypothetical protein